MTTEKYGLHEIDYSVQGWDAVLAADMQILDAVVPTREKVTLGETVLAYQPLYQAPDGKWYKAKADGTKQPCQGLALTGGDAEDQILVHRMGKIVNSSWSWATLGGQAPVYLSALTAGGLTQTSPGSNVEVIGYPFSATCLLVTLGSAGSGGCVSGTTVSRGGTVLAPTVAINVIVWRAPYACTVLAVKGYRVGGTGATINARKNGSLNHLSAALSLTSADTWMDGGAVQNKNYAIGDKLEIMIVSVAGDPDQVAVQVDFEPSVEPAS